MKGIVIQQSNVSYGTPQISQNKNVGFNSMQSPMTVNFTTIDHDPHSQSIDSINIPNEALVSGSGYCKIGDGIAAVEVILLTMKNFAQVPIKSIKKMKIYTKSQMQNHYVFKLVTEDSQKIFYLPIDQCFHFAYICFWAKVVSMGFEINSNEEFMNCCEGSCFKKAEILKNWEERYLLITQKDGLLSYKNKNQQPTLHVDTIQEFWTRFELIEGQKYIVFKFWYSIIKYEFAVPIYRCVKWFKAFYSMLAK